MTAGPRGSLPKIRIGERKTSAQSSVVANRSAIHLVLNAVSPCRQRPRSSGGDLQGGHVRGGAARVPAFRVGRMHGPARGEGVAEYLADGVVHGLLPSPEHCAASTAWSMLYLAISSWARADSASASSGNSVDSAFASSARILPRIRSSASPCAGDDPACAAPGGVHSCSSTGRCWSRCRSSTAVATAAVAAVPWRACQAPRYSASLPHQTPEPRDATWPAQRPSTVPAA